MIFDSPEMDRLRKKYAGRTDFRLPRILQLDLVPILQRERELLEHLVERAAPTKQREWVSRLLSEDDSEHLATWFELHLFEWLTGVGRTNAEPDIDGEKPDFIVAIGDGTGVEVVIEARAVLKTDETRAEDRATNEVFYAIHQLDLPYVVEIHDFRHQERFPTETLIARMRKWLSDSPTEFFIFEDGKGNRVAMSAQPLDHLTRTQGMMSGPFLTLTGDKLKSPLSKKAGQHRQLRKAGFPYVIALYLEDFMFDSELVVEAWFGKMQVQVRAQPMEVVSQSFDLSGIHFFGPDIVHTTVSGTLVFRHEFDEVNGVYYLRAHYVENPFAVVPIDPGLFPVKRRFVVVGRSPLRMAWTD